MKLHLGCGKRYIPGFKHIDIVEFPHVDIVSTVESLPMFEDNSVELIYNCHILEHFNKKQIPIVLKEWYRVLKPGGVLRVAVPDFKQCAAVYLSGLATLDQIHGPLIGGQKNLYDFHWSMFDETKLTTVLKDAGFAKVRYWDWRTTEHAHVDDFSQAYIPHMDKENGRLISLNMEAIK